MAGNDSIQFLRGNNISGSGQTLLPGQPAYDLSKGYLYVGDGSAITSTSPIKASYANSANTANTADKAMLADRANVAVTAGNVYGGANRSEINSYGNTVAVVGRDVIINGMYSVVVNVNNKGVISFPQKSGTVALTSDIKSPTVYNNNDGTVNITFN